MTPHLRILFAGGGTAGHVLPAIATEVALKELSSEQPSFRLTTEYLATKGGAERDILQSAGASIYYVPKTDFPRKAGVDVLTFLPRLLIAVARTLPVARRVDAVVGFGGYVALPAYLSAWILRKPLIIHEANALPGLANRFGQKIAARSLSNFEIPQWRAQDAIGLPIRESIWRIGALSKSERVIAQEQARESFGLAPDQKTVLVFGGSLGAAKLNEVLEHALNSLLDEGFQVLHGVGAGKSAAHARAGYHPVTYISDMERAYLAADVVVARSGAGTCAEIAAIGTPALLIPLSIGNGEQMLNAQHLAKSAHDRIRIIANDALTPTALVESVTSLANIPIQGGPQKISAAWTLAKIIVELGLKR